MASEQTYLKDRRIHLHNQLKDLLGSNEVYFQPPETVKINYPAIVYERYNLRTLNANNHVYGRGVIYRITVIDKKPDSEIVDKMTLAFPTIKFIRHTFYDNLNQDVFEIIY